MEKRTGENWQDSRRAVCQGVVEYWLPYGFFLQLLVVILESAATYGQNMDFPPGIRYNHHRKLRR